MHVYVVTGAGLHTQPKGYFVLSMTYYRKLPKFHQISSVNISRTKSWRLLMKKRYDRLTCKYMSIFLSFVSNAEKNKQKD